MPGLSFAEAAARYADGVAWWHHKKGPICAWQAMGIGVRQLVRWHGVTHREARAALAFLIRDPARFAAQGSTQ